MAASTNIFTEKETNNWFKACLALNCTKEGLTNFIETELQRVHAAVGGSCGNCSIENLMSCPTPGLCNKRKRNNCMFHQTKMFQQCQICDQVKQKIISFHRFYNPSWRNTKAERWATEPWEIGKCYLPPDGYKGVSVVQESDLNGILSLMLNCTHFETCLSASLSPKPPDPQCPLEKVRQIGRDVRHTADCKVNDADLHYYFQTLATLLADPKCLMHDPLAITARTKLTQLQNDRMSLFELGELLKDASQTLKQAKEAGEHFSKVAEITLEEALQSIEATIQAGKQHIETAISESKKKLDKHTQDSVRKILEETRVGIERIQQVEINQAMDDYGRDVDDMLRGLTAHYDQKLSYVTTSALNYCVQEKLRDIYMPPKLLLMTKDKRSFKKTGMQIKTYENMFLKHAKENHKTFIQGEAGTGKSTFLAKLVMDWCRIKLEKQLKTKIAHTDTQTNYASFFKDSWSLHCYSFVFHITLRNSVTEISIYTMIKEQIIDSIYSSEEDRKKAYTLLNEIMKRELCLILLDGLDEWTGPGSGYNLPTLVTSHRQCVILITTRPWKVAEGTFNHSEMHTLLQLEGVNDPFGLSRNLLSLIIDRKELSAKHLLFKRYVSEKKLNDLLLSPMMLSVILCSYAEGITLKGSKCEIYCIILESLLKKANSKISEFQHPPFPCFTGTQYIQPNIEHLNRLAEAAFHLLFSNTRENSLVFGISELKLYKLEEELETALKSGILSATPKASVLRLSSSFSFIHKSLQEFLAAYHIARNTQTINGIISEYLKRSNNSYLDVTEVLTFLCGLDISAANTLSDMMDKCDQLHYLKYEFKPSPFQHCVLSGYREAIANAQTYINLNLSHFNIDDENIHPDLHSLWVMNASSVEVLRVTVFSRDPLFDGKSSPDCEKSSSTMDFELSSCHKLKVLKLYGYGVCLKDIVSSATSVYPVRFLLNNSDPAEQPFHVLPSIEHIELGDVTCSNTWLRSLFNIIKTVKHNVKCLLEDCEITSFVNGTMDNSYSIEHTQIRRNFICKGNVIDATNIFDNAIDAVWEAWRRLDMTSLSVFVCLDSSTMKRVSSSGHSQISRTQMEYLNNLSLSYKKCECTREVESIVSETLALDLIDDDPVLLDALQRLNIKSLSLSGRLDNLKGEHGKLLSHALSSLNKLETPILEVDINRFENNICLLEALRGLPIISLSVRLDKLTGKDASELSHSLLSLKQLETLALEFIYISLFPPERQGMHIKSLSLSGRLDSFEREHVKFMSHSLLSMNQLETLFMDLSIGICKNNVSLLEALFGLHIRSLSLRFCRLTGQDASELSHSLLSLKQLETLALEFIDISPFPSETLQDVPINSLSLSGRLDSFEREHVKLLSHSLLSMNQLKTLLGDLSIGICKNNVCLLEALFGLHIRSLSLRLCRLTERDASELSHSLSSLKQLEVLCLQLIDDSPFLWKALHSLHIKSLSLSGSLNHSEEHVRLVSQSLLSLTQLETLSIDLLVANICMCESLCGLHIKSLSLSLSLVLYRLTGQEVSKLSHSLSSLKQLDVLSLKLSDDWRELCGDFMEDDSELMELCNNSDLWKVLHGLHIKNLRLNCLFCKFTKEHVLSLADALPTLTRLETLTMKCPDSSNPGLLKILNSIGVCVRLNS